MSQLKRHLAFGDLVNAAAMKRVGGFPFYINAVRTEDSGAWFEIVDPRDGVAVHFKFSNRANAQKARQFFGRALARCSIFSGHKGPKTKKNYENTIDRMTIVHESGDDIFAFTILNADGKAAASMLFMNETDAISAHAALQKPLSACIDLQCGGFSV